MFFRQKEYIWSTFYEIKLGFQCKLEVYFKYTLSMLKMYFLEVYYKYTLSIL